MRSRSTITAAGLAQASDEAESDADFLRRLGERVRTARARRGMTRKLLSQQSGVSQRYLAQVETGTGNLSILRLRQLAEAMGLPLSELVSDEPEQALELALTTEFLRRLAPEEVAAARQLLSKHFGSPLSRGLRRIALIGLRGGGKSTLGTALAKRLGIPFIELNQEVEKMSGISLSEIFNLYGQAAFRRYERRALEQVVEAQPAAVIATGGSLVADPATFDLLLASCYTIWIKSSPQEHMARVIAQGDYRPMADNAEAMEDLKQILVARAELYAMADATLDTSGRTVEESLDGLHRMLSAAPLGSNVAG